MDAFILILHHLFVTMSMKNLLVVTEKSIRVSCFYRIRFIYSSVIVNCNLDDIIIKINIIIRIKTLIDVTMTNNIFRKISINIKKKYIYIFIL